MNKILLLALFSMLSFPVCAQNNTAVISGKITAEDGSAIPQAYIFLERTTYYAETDDHGYYTLRAPSGNYTLSCSALGFEKISAEVRLDKNSELSRNLVLKADKNMALDEVQVTGKSVIRKVKESAFNVSAIDASAFYNSTSDLSAMLNTASGVKIRSSGGIGSDMAISLNGFTGRHVKVFIDGVPMSGFGSAFQINNIPVNIAERIEVYKGVVPINLGSDALGGAINIITKQKANTFLDASYSYGSFNTHRTNINLGYTSKSGFTVQLNAFQNYSDNNYKVKTKLLDLDTERLSDEEYWFKRFHDTYHNETVMAKVGMVNKSWADRIMIGATLGQEKADIQNSNLMTIVFGGKERKAKSLIPSFEYRKKDLLTRGLDASLTATYSQVRNESIDTMGRRYNWAGDYKVIPNKGEGQYSSSRFRNNNGSVIANLTYRISEKHQLALNNTFSGFRRKFSDDKAIADNSSAADSIKRVNNKNILGASYRFAPNRKWNTTVFGKYYAVKVTGPIDVSETTTEVFEEQDRRFDASGYGLASTYLLNEKIQLKASFEKTYRLPTSNELFGDLILETGNASLKAENSRNINLNVSYTTTFSKVHSLYIDTGFIYRDIRDYIQREIEQRYGGAYFVNYGKVRNLGADVEMRYSYKNRLTLGGSFTYQDMRNLVKYSSTGRELVYYKDRIKNVPYIFGNADASYFVYDLWGKGNTLTLSYNMQYVHEFFRSWESVGDESTKKTIPTQLSHDLSVTYAVKDGRYNITLEARNIGNEMMFDNYSLQKPGRAFFVRLRYYLFKNQY